MSERMAFIYRTTHSPTGATYIGQHRGALHDTYIGSGGELKKLIAADGRAAFRREVLQICSTQEELNAAEERWIASEKAAGRGELNLAPGGAGDNSEALKRLWSSSARREEQSVRLKEAWSTPAKRDAILSGQARAAGAEPAAGEVKSATMKRLWSDPLYRANQLERRSTQNFREAVAERNRSTKLNNREAIAEKTQLQWHRRLHQSREQARRTCKECQSLGWSIALTDKELQEVRSSSEKLGRIASTHRLTTNEVTALRRKDSNG